MHFYDYSSNCLDPAVYPRAKLVSEYGFQSFPSFSVYKQYTEPQDWSVNSNMSDYRRGLLTISTPLFDQSRAESGIRHQQHLFSVRICPPKVQFLGAS